MHKLHIPTYFFFLPNFETLIFRCVYYKIHIFLPRLKKLGYNNGELSVTMTNTTKNHAFLQHQSRTFCATRKSFLQSEISTFFPTSRCISHCCKQFSIIKKSKLFEKNNRFFQNFDFCIKFQILFFFLTFFWRGSKSFLTLFNPHKYHMN